ncbi:MAG: insulinase family protein, partial [Bacteroidales bacterium]|nr:insulinase family protein [Bacteroidales bacterium]
KLQQELISTLFNNNPRSQIVSSELLDNVSLQSMEAAYRTCFSNMNGALVTIVGNVDPETLKPLVELYLGSLPAGKKPAIWKVNDNRIQKGTIDNHFTVEMETPKTSIINVYTADMPYNLVNTVYMDAVQSVLNMAYIQSLREDEGGTYGASVQKLLLDRPEAYGGIIIAFDTDPEKQARMTEIVKADIIHVRDNGPSEEYVNKTKENFLKNRQENLISNSFWKQVITSYYDDGLDTFTDYESIVKGITPATLQDFFRDFLSQGNFIDISMSPAL